MTLSGGEVTNLPSVIQGGMGVGVSSWRLARAVSAAGQLGVVSGVALDALLARRLQCGDEGGHVRRALSQFPVPDVAQRVLDRYFVAGGKDPSRPFRPVPKLGLRPRRFAVELAVAANFVEVFLAKEGHHGVVGVNYLEKVQLATPAAVYGAMLAGVDYVLVGAGLPTEIPALLDTLAKHEPAELSVTVEGAASGERHHIGINPREIFGDLPPLTRPRMLAIVASATLVTYLARDPAIRPDGFILEAPVAGGHSAPPRGKLALSEQGEPVYGPRDEFDLAKVRTVGLPFWLAGGYASPAGLAEAHAAGAAGIQVGTAFALSRDSGLDERLRQRMLADARDGTLTVRNHPEASPTGFPFKLAHLPDTAWQSEVYDSRPRLCDLGYLRTPYRRASGAIGYRCPAEPAEEYVRKGGTVEETVGRRCLCNGLIATVGFPQHRADGYVEPAVVTLGQDLSFLPELSQAYGDDYAAADVIDYLLG